MARIDYIKYRLNNWQLWKVRESSGGLGYATCSVLLNEPVDGHRELMGTIEDTDAELTNQAVESLQPARPQLYMTLQMFYIGTKTQSPMGVSEIARRRGVSRSTINLHFELADQALLEWFSERVESKKVVCLHRHF
jgi:hypothetical protein